MSTTPELINIQREVKENPREGHKSIAYRLDVKPRIVIMVCKELNGPKCQHGTEAEARAEHKRRSEASKTAAKVREAKRKAEREAGLAPPVYKMRTVAMSIDDEDWDTFKTKHNRSAARRLGDLVRADIQSKTKKS